ncbi:TIGR03757 family integrating conjugative element protein [Escherichia coli]|jgi:integrating conjugative element protein (TIGR03757 family)|uniref:TIGR03757 family integrating conjugative element protein n=1 Tax=Escherichia coli TaxID=562 RepID=UPI0007515581|nr:TIGR03757 family integrating conjugative element protein [Escherichia coli]EKY0336453.1 TIGR03757 family integrating conjugative element protein [Escherichia coli O2:H6]HBP1550638.1 TIGR03757 family integrating conjugative element protein [Escherichia coli str. K-12 substr. MG1655star]HBR7498025.1 TIGR03757 family integrating conjugative element protein [Klebsiella pneumoniae]EEC8177966.1 TIGR03757 family integrating conjugative element protein [Escherichia coli]EFB4046327.1 TIGR03757 famil
MKLRNFILLTALMPVSVLAGMVVYTDSQHLPENPPPDVVVVLLDEPDQLQAEMFGELPADPQQAEAQVRQVMASSAWQQKQLQLNDSYRLVVRAWELGIKKVPAVVFDDRDVVYGTTDVDVATSLRKRGGGQ